MALPDADSWLVVASCSAAAGSWLQMFTELEDERFFGARMFGALSALESDEYQRLAGTTRLWPWSFRRRRALRRAAKTAVRDVLNAEEAHRVLQSERRGTGWALVAVGATVIAVQSAIELLG